MDIRIYDTREEMGRAAALDIEHAIADVLSKKPLCNMIFAVAPSQNEVLAALVKSESIEWSRVNAFHMDEYIGLPAHAPQGFANFLRRALFEKVPLGSVSCMDSTAQPEEEIRRYSGLILENPCDIVVLGIGENGHLAFNDPHVALFDDPLTVKIVELDPVCRTQQVHDGCFETLGQVPEKAMTLTIPALLRAGKAFCIVPGRAKALAVRNTVLGEIRESCPASVLRRHPDAVLYLDKDSGQLIKGSAPLQK